MLENHSVTLRLRHGDRVMIARLKKELVVRVRDKVMRTSSQGRVEINATRGYGVGLGIHKL